MNDVKHLCDRDRRPAYNETAREILLASTFLVGCLTGVVSTLFWMGVTA